MHCCGRCLVVQGAGRGAEGPGEARRSPARPRAEPPPSASFSPGGKGTGRKRGIPRRGEGEYRSSSPQAIPPSAFCRSGPPKTPWGRSEQTRSPFQSRAMKRFGVNGEAGRAGRRERHAPAGGRARGRFDGSEANPGSTRPTRVGAPETGTVRAEREGGHFRQGRASGFRTAFVQPSFFLDFTAEDLALRGGNRGDGRIGRLTLSVIAQSPAANPGLRFREIRGIECEIAFREALIRGQIRDREFEDL